MLTLFDPPQKLGVLSISTLPKIIAHRGGRFWEGDNFSYISDSVKEGAQIIELDICLSPENRYVVQHDKLTKPQGYLDDALPHIGLAVLYLDIKDSKVNVRELVESVRKTCSNHIMIGSYDRGLLSDIGDSSIGRIFHCILPWNAMERAESVGANWITPLGWFVTEQLVLQVQKAGFKLVPSGNPVLKKHEIMENQLRYARWGAHAISTHHVKDMKSYLEANL